MDSGADKPRHRCGINGRNQSPSPRVGLIFDGDNGGYAREVEQDEQQVAECAERSDAITSHLLSQAGILLVIIAEGVIISKRIIVGVEHSDGRCDNLLRPNRPHGEQPLASDRQAGSIRRPTS